MIRRGKNCQRPIAVMGVVDHLGHSLFLSLQVLTWLPKLYIHWLYILAATFKKCLLKKKNYSFLTFLINFLVRTLFYICFPHDNKGKSPQNMDNLAKFQKFSVLSAQSAEKVSKVKMYIWVFILLGIYNFAPRYVLLPLQ